VCNDRDVMPARTKTRSSPGPLAYLALLAAIAGIAWSAIFVRWAGIPGSASAFYRVSVAGAVLIPWLLLSRTRETGTVGILRTGAGLTAILGNNTPIFVGVLSWLAFRGRPRASFWIGMTMSLAGCLSIMLEPSAAGSAPMTLHGNLMAIGASLFFAAYLVTTERVRREMDTLTFNTLAIAGSIVTLLVVCLALRLPLGGYPPRAWAALVALGLVSQLGAYYALVYALGHLPATLTSVSLLAQVPCTAFLAWLLLGEPLTMLQIAGGTIVVAGISVVVRGA
jgi:drug/metabolite transporter (DMT)-like permease